MAAAVITCPRYDVPLVADIHFQPAVAMLVAEAFEKVSSQGSSGDEVRQAHLAWAAWQLQRRAKFLVLPQIVGTIASSAATQQALAAAAAAADIIKMLVRDLWQQGYFSMEDSSLFACSMLQCRYTGEQQRKTAAAGTAFAIGWSCSGTKVDMVAWLWSWQHDNSNATLSTFVPEQDRAPGSVCVT